MQRIAVLVLLVLSFAGLADSFYLAQHDTEKVSILCTGSDLSGCNIVAASPYSHFFGIPLAEYGVLFYAGMFILAALELLVLNRLLRRILQWAALGGAISSLYFVFVQLFVINALCAYCLTSAGISFLALIFSVFVEPIKKQNVLSLPPAATPRLIMPPRP